MKTPDKSLGWKRLSRAEWRHVAQRIRTASAKDIGRLLRSRDQEGDTALGRAVDEDDFLTIRALLRAGMEIDEVSDRGTALLKAASKGKLQTVRLLLAHGANPNAAYKSGMNGLHYAASEGKVGIVRALLRKRANVDAADQEGRTPLYRATDEGQLPAVHLLLRWGANPNHITSYGRTALLEAAHGSYVSIIKALLKHSANPDIQDSHGRTALHEAASSSERTAASALAIVESLLACGANPNLRKDEGGTPLSDAAGRGNVEIALSLLEAGADARLGSQGENLGFIPLHGAARMGDPRLVTALLERGASPQVKEGTGWTPLQYALQMQNEECIRLLVEKDPSIPALHRASINGDVAAIRSCLSSDTVNSWDANGLTPLYWATKAGHEEAVILLLEAGASPNTEDASGETPLMNAANRRSLETVRRLLAHGADVNHQSREGWTALIKSSHGSGGQDIAVEITKSLLEAGANLHLKGRAGVSALSIAAYYGQAEIVRCLLAQGADVNTHGEDGETPLMDAVQHGHHPTIRVLLEHGADLNAQTNDGWNALKYADWWCDPCGTAELLLAAGAKPA